MKLIYSCVIIISSLLLWSCKGEKGEPTTTSAPNTANIKVHKPTSSPKPKPRSTPVVEPSSLEWMTMDQINEIKSPGSKKYVIDIYTEWCSWCKIMDKKTFRDPEVQQLLKDEYHLVKFNAERKEPVAFKGRKYEWQPGGRRGNNALAIELLDGRMSYPSLVFLDKDLNPIKISVGYKNPQQMIQELEIIGKS